VATEAPPAMLHLSLPVGYGIPPRQLVRLACEADEAGLSGIVAGELTSTDALALIAAAGPATRQLRLESSVVSVLTRSPALLAMSAATLADLCDGRFVLGLGAGSPIVAGYHGQTFADALGRTERWLVDLRAALAGRTLAEWGSFRLRGLDPQPVPLLLAAMNPGMLAVAGRAADGVILNFAGPGQVAGLVRAATEARASAEVGQSFEVHTTLWVDAGGDADRARDRFRTEMAPYLAVSTYRSAMVALADEDAVDHAADAWRRDGREAAAALFPEPIVDAMVATGAEDLAGKVADLHRAGCTGVRVTPLTHDPGSPADAEAAIPVLADALTRLRRA
jgi:alkanesulfonate monooxygenase SsuD/methylene tetrahydromethanopterin reductase-like flavin-dependent oxidoreductase (luciferase family)